MGIWLHGSGNPPSEPLDPHAIEAQDFLYLQEQLKFFRLLIDVDIQQKALLRICST